MGRVVMARVCEHCGADTYKAENFDRVRDGANRWRERWEQQSREIGLLTASLGIAEAERMALHAGLQRKIARQARVIRRLESRLRNLGKPPHSDVHPGEASPVLQGEG